MSRWLRASIASSALVLLCLCPFLPWEAHADDIVISNPSEIISFITSPGYISWRARIFDDYFRMSPDGISGQSLFLTRICDFPCGANGPVKVKPGVQLFTTTPVPSFLHIEGQNYGKWFRASEIRFDLDSVVVTSVGTASTYTWVKQSMLLGMSWLSEYDRPSEFEPVTMIPNGHPLLHSFARGRFSLVNTGVTQQAGPPTPSSSESEAFNFSERIKPRVREHKVWPMGIASRRVFEPRIPLQFWRRIDPYDNRIIPAVVIPIRGKGDEAPIAVNGRFRR